jgi:outer membrane protein TolC
MRWNLNGLALPIFLASASGIAADKSDINVEEWFKLSWQHSPEVREADAKVELATSNSDLANSFFYPTLSAKYVFRDNEITRTTKVFSLNAEQNLFRGFKDYYDHTKTHQLVDAEKNAFEGKKLSIAKTVSDTLLSLATATAQKKIYDENSKILDRRLTEFKRRSRIGKSRDVDVIQNQIDRLKLERLRATNEQNFASAIAKLNEYTGKKLAASPFSSEALLRSLYQYHTAMEKKSFQREELKLRLSAQETAVKSARSTFWPTLKAVGSYYPERDSHYSNFTDDWSVGFDFEWKFFEGFAGKAAVNQERAKQIIAESGLSKYDYNDEQTLESLKVQWAQFATERNLLNEAEQLAVKEFQAQERDFRLGLVTVLELSTSDEQYLNLKLERIAIDEKLGNLLSAAIERGGIEGLKL